ncbi:hypothetical protein MACK_002562 [Theileria orientalis]|uniref:Uncharacterized protein n=1 Tax=Theileria orientalis TaxID=68886 RepID=A0A976MD56_THEOR|nr:hypothetical protein MACK_002562 [Theileria orientalis]
MADNYKNVDVLRAVLGGANLFKTFNPSWAQNRHNLSYLSSIDNKSYDVIVVYATDSGITARTDWNCQTARTDVLGSNKGDFGYETNDMVTYELDKKGQYPSFIVGVTQPTGNTTTKVTHTPKTPTPGQVPTLQFNNQRVNLNGYSPSDKLTSIDVYFLRTSGIDDTQPFIVVFNESNRYGRTGAGNKKIFYLNDPEPSDGSPGANDWNKWEEFTEAEGTDQEIVGKMECEVTEDGEDIVHAVLATGESGGDVGQSSLKTYDTLRRIKRDTGGRKGGSCGGGESSGSGITKETDSTVITGLVAGGTVVVAAVSAVGYLWHTIPTRTIRDLTAYF